MLVPEQQSSSSNSNAGASPTHTVSIQQNDALKDGVQRILVSMLLFALFGEWLYPLYSLINEGETFNVTIFFILTGLLLFFGCLRLPVFLYASFPPLLVIGTMLYIYGREKGLGWFASYMRVGADDVSEIFHSGRLYGISMESRILLLLIGWTLLVISVQMLAISKGSIILFFSVTILYLLALDLAFDLSVYAGLVRAVSWGLLLQVFVFIHPVVKNRKAWIIVGSATAMICVLGAVLLSLVIPNRPTVNIPWDKAIQAFGDWSGATSPSSADYAVSGYSRDDTELGSSLTLRHELFFTALSPRSTYWRGESKSFYSGRGWTQDPSIVSNSEMKMMESTFWGASTSNSEWIQQVITFNTPVSGTVVLIGGGIPVSMNSMNLGKNQEGSSLSAPRFDAESDALVIDSVTTAQPLQGYELTVALQQAPSEKLRLIQGSDPEDILERYLQLPVNLPERVRNLGISLVKNTSNRYDAVLAVMDYLESNYTYSLTSNIPPKGTDFVDHFLFEEQSGYCDHFSTSMAVLLRSAGIPARWVKGFAPGERSKVDNQLYSVSYADAHAWIEVYFPSEGWVPFDPTPGFDYTESTAIPPRNNQDEGDGMLSRFMPIVSKAWEGLKQGVINLTIDVQVWLKRYLVGATAIVLGIGLLIMIYREFMVHRNIILLWLQMVKPYRRFPDRIEMLCAADRVWSEIYVSHGSKPQTMTVREYSQSITWNNPATRARFEQFISVWESLYYGRIRIDRKGSRDFLKDCWILAVQQE